MGEPVNFDGWASKPTARVVARTAHPDGWGGAYADALAATGPRTAAQIRALAIGTALDAAHLRGQISIGADGATTADPAQPATSTAARIDAARTLERACYTQLIAYCPAPEKAKVEPTQIDLSPSSADAMGWPQVVIILAVAGVVAFAIHEAGAVAERWAAERERTRQLEESHRAAAELVRSHVDREKAAGTTLPLDPATHSALDALAAEQAATAARLTAPRTSVKVDGGTTVALLLAAGIAVAFALSR
jgi:hypothetical protein